MVVNERWGTSRLTPCAISQRPMRAQSAGAES
jgi:hypothetical protein